MADKQSEQITHKLIEAKRSPKTITITNSKNDQKEQYYRVDLRKWKCGEIRAKTLSEFFSKIDLVLENIGNKNTTSDKNVILLGNSIDLYIQNVRIIKLIDYSAEKQKRISENDTYTIEELLSFLQGRNLKYISDIADGDVNAYKYHCLNGLHNAPSTFDRKLMVLIAINNYISNKTEYQASNCNLGKFKTNVKRELTTDLTEEDIVKIINCASHAPHLQRIIKFITYTGFRNQNAHDLQWREVRLGNKQITIQTKCNKTHTVPIIPQLVELLDEIKQEQIAMFGCVQDYIFLYKGKRVKNARKSLSTALKKANITLPRGQKFHAFRHGFAINLINNGVPLYAIQKILGHSDAKMTQRYARFQTETLAKEMEKVFGK